MASQSNVVPIASEQPPISLTEAQHRFGVKRQTIERLIHDHYINPKKFGRKYDPDSLCWELIRHYKGKDSSKNEATEKEEADIRFTNARAEKVELENAKTKSELIPVTEHRRAVNEIAIAVLDIFGKVGVELPGLLAESPDQEREFLPIVEGWAAKARRRLADSFKERDGS